MATIGALLSLIGTLAAVVSFAGIVHPLKRLGLPTRKRAALALLISLWMIGTGGGLIPAVPAGEGTAEPPAPPAQPAAVPGPDRIAGGNQVGCRGCDTLGRLTRYPVQGDREAWMRALAEAVLSGECVLFEADEAVFLSDTAFFSGQVRVRRKGELAEYWTAIEVVTR